MLEGVSGNLENAIDYTRQALALTPESTGAANNLARFLILKEMPAPSDLDDALEAINRAIEREPLFPEYLA